MTFEEASLVRNRLNEYQTWKVLAKQREEEAKELEEVLLSMGSPQSPKVSPKRQNPVPLESRYNAVLTKQQELLADAESCKECADQIGNFLQDNFSGEKLELFRDHFCRGIKYEDLAGKFSMSPQGLRHTIFRSLMKLDFSRAYWIT